MAIVRCVLIGKCCKYYLLIGQDAERSLVTEIGKILSGGGAFFGWSSQGSVDISLSAQRHASGETGDHGGPPSPGQDGQYIWNRLLLLPYLRAGVNILTWCVRFVLIGHFVSILLLIGQVDGW